MYQTGTVLRFLWKQGYISDLLLLNGNVEEKIPFFHYSNALLVLYQITRRHYQRRLLNSLNRFSMLKTEESLYFTLKYKWTRIAL